MPMFDCGNSAGQAVIRFSRYARQVTLLSAAAIVASMSQYLIDQLSSIPHVDVRVRAQVVSLEADDRLRAVIVRSGDSTEPVRLPAAALFICIGGMPRTDGAAGIGLATNAAGYLVTGGDGGADREARDLYDRDSVARRPPLLPRWHQATDEGSAACSQFGLHGRLRCRIR
jgi:thioredoxin reductase